MLLRIYPKEEHAPKPQIRMIVLMLWRSQELLNAEKPEMVSAVLNQEQGLKFLGTRQIHFRAPKMCFRLTMAIGFSQLVLLTVTFAEQDQLTGVFHFESVGSYSSGTEPHTKDLESNF